MKALKYGDVVAFQEDNGINFGVITAIIERQDQNGTTELLEIWRQGDSSPITKNLECCINTDDTREMGGLIFISSHWAREQSAKLVPPKKAEVLFHAAPTDEPPL